MVIADLDVVRITVHEPKTNSPLIVHRNGVLPFAVVLQRVKMIARWHFQVAQGRRQVDVLEFACGSPGYIGWETGRLSRQEQVSGAFVRERLDHRSIVACHVTRVNTVQLLPNQQMRAKRAVKSSADCCNRLLARRSSREEHRLENLEHPVQRYWG